MLAVLRNALGGALWVALTCAHAFAAELSWQAPAECGGARVVQEQIEKLIGAPLTSIDGVDFEVEIAASEDGRSLRVRLRTLPQGGAPRERALAGSSCEEVTDAVSVAIALAITEREQQRAELSAKGDGAVASAGADAATPQTDRPAQPPRWAVGLGLLAQGGVLPEGAFGGQASAAFELGALRLGAFFALFAPQEVSQQASTTGVDGGGRFDLVLAGLEACAHPNWQALHLLTCAGFEFGRISAEGRGVLNERTGDSALYAPRVELGLGYEFDPSARIWLRGGAAVNLARPEFLLNDRDRVHQPATVALRGGFGVELLL